MPAETTTPKMQTEHALFDRIEREQWAICPQVGGGWVIEGDAGDGDVLELARTRGPLRMALNMAAQESDRYSARRATPTGERTA